MIVIGHRGAAGHEPENTLRSFSRALSMQVDWVEFDVQGVDGELLVFHDDTLERTTNGAGMLAAQTFINLRKLDAGLGEQIPTLTEVLDLIDARISVNIEIKGPGIADAVDEIIRDYHSRSPAWNGRILVSSFDLSQMQALACREREYSLGLLYSGSCDEALARALELGAFSIHPALRQINQELVRKAHSASLKVLVYTVNNEKDIVAMQAMGVDGVFSDYPDRVIALK
ncbi:MAG: glycerophosphoryl diester phosphodiesterase [Lysobacterales bacterium]|jgi:glycerophosphoryl diester phosphodiesterase